MMDHINYFNPFKTKPGEHEDTLTRAFLVLVRLSPAMRAAFLEMIRAHQHEKGCEPSLLVPSFALLGSATVDVRTQIERITETEGALVSVLIANEKYEHKGEIKGSDRKPVYDGLLTYTGRLVVVIENKPCVENVWFEQLRPRLPKDCQLALYDRLVSLRWRDIISTLLDLAAGKTLHPSEQTLVSDFQEFIAEKWPELNPYKSLRQCGKDAGLQRKRCRMILEDLLPRGSGLSIQLDGESPYIPVGLPTVQRVMLTANDKNDRKELGCALGIWPADNVTQARPFYKRLAVVPGALERILALSEGSCEVRPNLHFSYQGTQLVFPEKVVEPGAYLRYWCGHQALIHRVAREGIEEFLRRMQADGMISAHDAEEARKKFSATAHDHLNPCPGLEIFYRWPRETALELDDKGKLKTEVLERAREALEAVGEKSPV